MPYAVASSSEIACCATIPDSPRASFVRTASTVEERAESRIDQHRRIPVARLKSVRSISRPHSPRGSAKDRTLRQRRGESSKAKEDLGTLDDLEQNEDGRGVYSGHYQPL